MQASAGRLTIDPGLNPAEMAAVFRRYGRLHIPGFLTDACVQGLHEGLMAETLWVCSTIGGGQVADIPVEMLDALSAQERATFEGLAHHEARDGFHYMFDSLRISDAAEKGEPLTPLYRSILDFVNSDAFLDFVRVLTGDDRPVYVDAQATRFRPGHYLTAHDDLKPAAGRLYAYVLNLTPYWRADWGGVLNFLDDDGHVSEGYSPHANALNIFRVPQPHAVSFVAPFAGAPRFSVAGWVRDAPPPPAH